MSVRELSKNTTTEILDAVFGGSKEESFDLPLQTLKTAIHDINLWLQSSDLAKAYAIANKGSLAFNIDPTNGSFSFTLETKAEANNATEVTATPVAEKPSVVAPVVAPVEAPVEAPVAEKPVVAPSPNKKLEPLVKPTESPSLNLFEDIRKVSLDDLRNKAKSLGVNISDLGRKKKEIIQRLEEAMSMEAPVEEAPVEEAPVEEAPVEEAPVEEAPVEEAPDDEDSDDEEAHVEDFDDEDFDDEDSDDEDSDDEDSDDEGSDDEGSDDEGSDDEGLDFLDDFDSKPIDNDNSSEEGYEVVVDEVYIPKTTKFKASLSSSYSAPKNNKSLSEIKANVDDEDFEDFEDFDDED